MLWKNKNARDVLSEMVITSYLGRDNPVFIAPAILLVLVSNCMLPSIKAYKPFAHKSTDNYIAQFVFTVYALE
jgi:hypothetical protein